MISTIFRISFRAILVGSFWIHTLTLLAVRHQKKKYKITDRILHDGDSFDRRSRHNRAMVTLRSVGAWLLIFIFGLIGCYVFWRTKRTMAQVRSLKHLAGVMLLGNQRYRKVLRDFGSLKVF